MERTGRSKKLIAFWAWCSSPLPEYCRKDCYPAYAQKGEKTPCDDCPNKAPELMPENAEAWYLWQSICTQWVVSMAGLVGLNYQSIYLVADTLMIDVTPSVLAKIQALERKCIEKNKKGGDN